MLTEEEKYALNFVMNQTPALRTIPIKEARDYFPVGSSMWRWINSLHLRYFDADTLGDLQDYANYPTRRPSVDIPLPPPPGGGVEQSSPIGGRDTFVPPQAGPGDDRPTDPTAAGGSASGDSGGVSGEGAGFGMGLSGASQANPASVGLSGAIANAAGIPGLGSFGGQSTTGSTIGGLIGTIAGMAVGIPGMGVVGAFAGGALGQMGINAAIAGDPVGYAEGLAISAGHSIPGIGMFGVVAEPTTGIEPSINAVGTVGTVGQKAVLGLGFVTTVTNPQGQVTAQVSDVPGRIGLGMVDIGLAGEVGPTGEPGVGTAGEPGTSPGTPGGQAPGPGGAGVGETGNTSGTGPGGTGEGASASGVGPAGDSVGPAGVGETGEGGNAPGGGDGGAGGDGGK